MAALLRRWLRLRRGFPSLAYKPGAGTVQVFYQPLGYALQQNAVLLAQSLAFFALHFHSAVNMLSQRDWNHGMGLYRARPGFCPRWPRLRNLTGHQVDSNPRIMAPVAQDLGDFIQRGIPRAGLAGQRRFYPGFELLRGA